MNTQSGCAVTLAELVQFLSLPLSLFVAWLTVKLSTKDQRSIYFMQEIIGLINEMINQSRKAKNSSEDHFLGVGENFKSQRKEILREIKKLEILRSNLESFIDESEGKELKIEILNWKKGLTDDPFPIEKKQDVRKPGDYVFKRIDDSQSELEMKLNEIKAKVFRGQCLR